MLESNYLTMLLKPTYGKPVDTMEDILDMGLTLMAYPGQETLVEGLKNSPSSLTRQLAEKTIVAKVIF